MLGVCEEMSKTEFAKFKKECERWIDAFGLSDWMIEVIHDSLPARDCQVKARVLYNFEQRAAKIILNKEFIHDSKDGVSAHSTEGAALHEVLHIALAAYGMTCAKLQSTDHDLAQSEEHGLMRRIMRALKVS